MLVLLFVGGKPEIWPWLLLTIWLLPAGGLPWFICRGGIDIIDWFYAHS